MCILWHNWHQWSQYEFKMPERRLTENWGLRAAKQLRQKRICKDCGKMQDKLIREELL